MRCAEESQKLPIIALSLSTVHPICAVMIWAFEALMAALAGKIMAPIIFNELHQEVSMGLLSLEQRHVGKQLCFLVIKMAVSLCEAKEQCFPFWALLDLKGPRKTARKETSPSPVLVPFALTGCIYEPLAFMESISSAEWNLLYHRFSIHSETYVLMENAFWLKQIKTKQNRNKQKQNPCQQGSRLEGGEAENKLIAPISLTQLGQSWLFCPDPLVLPETWVFMSTATSAQSQSFFVCMFTRT